MRNVFVPHKLQPFENISEYPVVRVEVEAIDETLEAGAEKEVPNSCVTDRVPRHSSRFLVAVVTDPDDDATSLVNHPNNDVAEKSEITGDRHKTRSLPVCQLFELLRHVEVGAVGGGQVSVNSEEEKTEEKLMECSFVSLATGYG